ncbi:sulfite exporter TauE/SafE family protein [Nocardioides caricicola]|uniref:Probable membrane transporter protein n=1 Tax=Nocardioides caricicola TaxID=634770 RepID=A0ABW0MYE4_9ACTN
MLTTLLAVLVLGFAAAVQMASGFGFALMAVPMLAVVVGAHDAVLLAVLAGAVFCAYQAIEGRGHRDGWVVARLLAGAAAGLPVGYLVFRRIDADLLTLLIGVLVLVATAALAKGLMFSSRSPAADLVAGACAGVLTTSTATNGPPVVLLLSGRRLPQQEFRATLTAVFLVVDVAAVAMFAAGGELDRSLLEVAYWCLPGLLAGGYAGWRARALLSPERFQTLVLALLALAGGTAVLAALT